MAQLHVTIDHDRLAELQRYAEQQRLPVAVLLERSIDYLLDGGQPVGAASDEESPSAAELARLVMAGGALDFLADEPDLYSLDDGERV